MVDKCKPGDDISVVGILKTRWKPLAKEARPDVEMVRCQPERHGPKIDTRLVGIDVRSESLFNHCNGNQLI